MDGACTGFIKHTHAYEESEWNILTTTTDSHKREKKKHVNRCMHI